MSDPGGHNRQVFRQFMESRGLKIKPWAKRARIAEGTIHNFLNGATASLTYSTLQKLAAAADANVSELTGEPIPVAESPMKHVIGIKSLEVRAGAGNGFTIVEEPEAPPFYVRRDIISQVIGSDQPRLRCVQFRGDSMLPTIQDGDIGIIRLMSDAREFQPGLIYVLWDGIGVVVKRIESIVGGRPRFRIISDNSNVFPPYEVDAADAHIIGPVLWRFGRL